MYNNIQQEWGNLRGLNDKIAQIENLRREYQILPIEAENSGVLYALKITPLDKVKVLIFGQDPYPRAESAIGIAFCDGKIKKWTDPTCPSLRNIFKSVLIHYKYLNPSSKVEELRSTMSRIKMISPYNWFFETAKQGVLWLNTSLTYTSNVLNFFYSLIYLCFLCFLGCICTPCTVLETNHSAHNCFSL